MIQFICGCRCGEITARDNLATMDSVVLDAEGFLTCKVHRERRAGWRSVPYTATKMPFPGVGAWSPLEWECWLLYDEKPEIPSLPIVLGGDDWRDNRDPVEIGNNILRNVALARATPGNGHAPKVERDEPTQGFRHYMD